MRGWPDVPRASPRAVLLALGLVAALCIALFMTLGVQGSWAFVLPFRAGKVATMLLVACAIAVSTVLFQTATGNRILTPAIMGFDSLYVLIQTCLVFFMGSAAMAAADRRLTFAGETAAMVLFSALLHWVLFSTARRSLHMLVLAGVVLGVLFRSLAAFLQRVIDPNEFAFLQDRFFASFNNPHGGLLMVSALAMLGAALLGLRAMRSWDVLALGRETAIGLGVAHRREVTRIMAIVAVLVSVSTALVGPVTFLGLLVANLAYAVMPSFRHVHVLPAAILLAVISLVGGQMLLERVFAFDTNLRVIIDFLGGLTFIALLLRGRVR
ncbi:iron chelate uptake ABC transporter family permease subunit [Roseococcus suduntuyensis]|uniref:Iron complex transport system permease protein n=1 Tax=Roseococcus suduntuyensis TaxID=455361 RepID=A0A840AIG3_9PROT|nr:iron chelate uptake ABC transporter family permease subunit [Roseococcus suduntuyensis]MBB3900326.1 iron complex transport system permease protein [Roseococcus suduntuyensis]